MSICRVWIALPCLLFTANAQAGPRTDQLGDPLPDAAVARFGSTRLRHPGPILALVWSPDGKFIASSAWREDCRVRLWDAKTGQLVRVLGDAGRAINCLSFSADSKTLAGGSNGFVHIWDVESGKETATLDPIPKKDRDEYESSRNFGGIGPPPKTYTVVFAPDGKTLVAGTFHRRLLYDARTFETRAEFTKPLCQFERAAYTPDGATLVTAESTKSVDLWDPQTGKHRRGFEVEGPPRHVNIFGLAITADGKHAAFKLLEAIVVVELETGKTVWREPSKSYGEEPVALSRDGLLAFAGKMGVRIWDWQAKKLLADITEGGELIRCVCFSPDGKRLAWSGSDGNIRIWDVAEKKEALVQPGHRGAIELFALRADGKQFATVDYAKTLRVWDTKKGEAFRATPLADLIAINCLALPRDGSSALLGDSRSRVATIDVVGLKQPAVVQGPVRDRYVSAFSPDGIMALAVDPNSGVTHLVSDRGKTWTNYTGGLGLRSFDARFSDDAKNIFISGWDYLSYLDVNTQKELWRVTAYANPNFVRGSLACSPNGRYVAAGITSMSNSPRQSAIHIWETSSGREWKTLQLPQVCVNAAAFSADSRFLAVACADYEVNASGKRAVNAILVEVASGREIARFTGHDSVVRSLAFAPDSRTFYSASNDGTVLQWDWLGLPNADAQVLTDQTWSDLANPEGPKVYRALRQLAASPKDSVALLTKRLQPPPVATRAIIARLKKALDSDIFKERDAAARELDALGEQVVTALEDALLLRPSAEAEKSIRKLLRNREANLYPPEELRRARAVLMLERLGGTEAKKLLEIMAASKADALSVRQAREALARLKNIE